MYLHICTIFFAISTQPFNACDVFPDGLGKLAGIAAVIVGCVSLQCPYFVLPWFNMRA